jgi:hypothetical protein
MLGLVRDSLRLRLADAAAPGLFEQLEKAAAHQTLQLFQLPYRQQDRQRPALARDQELVLAKRDTVQEIAQPLPDFERGHRFGHGFANMRNHHSWWTWPPQAASRLVA